VPPEDAQGTPTTRELPESLAAFLEAVSALPLPRDPPPVPSGEKGEGTDSRKRAGAGQGLARGMNPKKFHEVERLAALVASSLGVEVSPTPSTQPQILHPQPQT